MYWTIQTTATAIRPMKMIGSQVRAKLCMSFQNEPPLAAGSASSGSDSTRIASVPSLRDSTCEVGSMCQPSGSSAPGSRSAARTASLASPQLICEVSSTVSL